MIWMQQVVQDAGFAVRMLRRLPAFTITVVLTLALGIGLTTAVFSVFNAVLLRPLAYPDQERLVWLSMHDPRAPFPMAVVLGPDFLDWRTGVASFEHLVAYTLSDEPVIVSGAATRERVASVSDGFWELSGVRLAQGRMPASGERDTLVVSHDFFDSKLAGDPTALGKAVTVDGRAATVVGVLPRGFPFQLPWPGWPGFEPGAPVAYRTIAIEPPRGAQIQLLNVIGKLRPGITIEAARAELDVRRARTAQERPMYPGNRMSVRMVPLSRELSGDAPRALGVIFSAVVFVLLIACANVASLLLGRGSARRKEIAIRTAVGAGRARLLRQLILESLILALTGGAAGLILAHWAVSLIVSIVPYALPRLIESSIDGRVLLFTLAASVATALASGVGPALALGRVNLSDTLKLGAKPATSVAMNPRAGRLLVAMEVALAVVLLTGAGLLVKSFWRLNSHPPGFEPARVLTMKVQFGGEQYQDDGRRKAYIEEFLRRTASVPGVTAAGISTHGDTRTVALVEGAPPRPPEEVLQRSSVLLNSVSPGSAQALGLRLLQGRWIADHDSSNAVVVNESLARRDFPGEAAVGRRIRLSADDAPFVTIVGVVADLKYASLAESLEPEVYVPYSQEAPWSFTAVVRTPLEPAALLASMRASLSAIDATLPVYDVETLEDALAGTIAPERFNVFLLSVFAAAALGLAMTGVYGVIAYSVSTRTHEIGVRMALGADRRTVAGMIVRQALSMAALGVAAGVGAALILTRVLESLLYGVRPTDAPTFAIAAAGLLGAALAASLVPALRAARIDPAETLR